tara:strand:+ start:40874 stop:42367 length:1494 start_codon:yes stop_codon:yes gene_type:complete
VKSLLDIQRASFNANALVLGAGISGLACTRWLLYRGCKVTLTDSRSLDIPLEQSAELSIETGVNFRSLDIHHSNVDLIVTSPGLSPFDNSGLKNIINKTKNNILAVTEIDLFDFEINQLRDGSKSEKNKIIAVTGTNGKTSVVNLVKDQISEIGLDAQMAGNVGPSLLEALFERAKKNCFPDVWVLELSSFQLALTNKFSPDIACILNVSEDHLDWHKTKSNYLESKLKVFGIPKPTAVPIIFEDDQPLKKNISKRFIPEDKILFNSRITFSKLTNDSKTIFGISHDHEGKFFFKNENNVKNSFINLSEIELAGEHNFVNILFSFSLTYAVNDNYKKFSKAVLKFKTLSHRLENVYSSDLLNIIDDSKATNTSATVAALNSFNDPIILVLGGDLKGQCLGELTNSIEERNIISFVFGKDKKLIFDAFSEKNLSIQTVNDLNDLMIELRKKMVKFSEQKLTILFSPACSSTDMFKNYVHRAQEFRKAIKVLFEEGKHA